MIVGLTPGSRQAADALTAYRSALVAGETIEAALAKAKKWASFSGPMRRNLVDLLDGIGLSKALGIDSCASLWHEASNEVHFTSSIRYPLFVDGTNWSGNPDILRTPQIRSWLETYAPAEFGQLTGALFVPLGGSAARALSHLADKGHVRHDAILTGLPHPSGANAERIACFLGRKSPALASSRTDGHSLVQLRGQLTEQVGRLTARMRERLPDATME